MIDPGSDVSLSMISLTRFLKPRFADLAEMAPQPLPSYLGRAFSTWSTMCSGCFPSAATCRPNVFGKTSASPRTRGTRAASSSGPNIVLKRQGLSLRRLGSNGSSARAVEQLLHQRVRRWRRQLKSCPSKTKTHSSERDLGRLGLPARAGPEARLLGAGGTSLPTGSRFCRHHGGGGVAVDDWSKHLQNALAKRDRKRKIRNNLQEIRSD